MIFERARFNRLNQVGRESITFVTAVHALAEHCEFGVLRDRIVVGIQDARLKSEV